MIDYLFSDEVVEDLPSAQAVSASGNDNNNNKLNSVGSQVGTIQMSMIAVIAWVVIVTLALIALAVVTFRRWRRDYSFNTGNSVSGSSAVSDSEFGDGISNMGSVIAINEASAGSSNQGFSYSEENLSEICIGDPSPSGSASPKSSTNIAPVHASPDSTHL